MIQATILGMAGSVTKAFILLMEISLVVGIFKSVLFLQVLIRVIAGTGISMFYSIAAFPSVSAFLPYIWNWIKIKTSSTMVPMKRQPLFCDTVITIFTQGTNQPW